MQRCPGCHIECPVELYSCARGKGYFLRREKGEDLPNSHRELNELRRKQADAGRSPAPRMSSTHLVMFMLGVLARAVLDRTAMIPAHRTLSVLDMHQGAATRAVLLERTMFSEDVLDSAIGELEAGGFARYEERAPGREFLCITELGREQVQAWNEADEAEDEAILANISEQDRKQLLECVREIVSAAKHA